jgi:hypothetical protein
VNLVTSATDDFFTRNLDNSFTGKRFNYFSQVYGKAASTSVNVQAALDSANAFDSDSVHWQVGAFKQVSQGTYNNFDIIKQIANIETVISNASVINLSDFQEDKKNIKPIIDRLSQKLGTSLDQKQFVTAAFSTSTQKYISPLDIFNIEKKISAYVSQRYSAILSATNLINNLDQMARFNSPDTSALTGLLMPNLFPSAQIPSFMSHMIEDESEDDYGWGAGKRFIIQPKDILKVSYGEQSPEFTSVSVKGAEEGGLVGGQGFNIGGGMEIHTVWATDYDLWRMYGYKEATPKYMPMLSNVETQIAPYAIFMLNQQRAGLLHASVTRTGSEFVQPGEVYYLQDRGLLFYCEDVRHSFTYGSSFTTTMTLTYGHTLGEYIPTPLDVIGKGLYRGHHTNVGSYRMSHPSGANVSPDEVSIGALALDINAAGNSVLDGDALRKILFSGRFGERNKNTLIDALYKLRNIVDSSGSSGDNRYAMVSVRVYEFKESDIGSVFGQNITNAAVEIISCIQNPSVFLGQVPGAGKSEEDSSPMTRIPKSKILGGSDISSITTDAIGEPRMVLLGQTKKTSENKANNAGSFTTIRTISAPALLIAKEMANDASFFRDFASSIGNLFSSTPPEEQMSIESKKIQNAISGGIIDIWVEYVVPSNELKSQVTTYANKNKATTKPDISPVEEFYQKLAKTTGQSQSGKSYQISITVNTGKTPTDI